MGKPTKPPDRLSEQFTVTSAVLVQEPGEPAELKEPGGCASGKEQGSDGHCASSGVRQSGDPGGGPEPEARCKPACGKPLGVLDEIQTLDRATGAQM
ncbi:MAG: hypothetical protein ACK56F_22480, partial [bacterium]